MFPLVATLLVIHLHHVNNEHMEVRACVPLTWHAWHMLESTFIS